MNFEVVKHNTDILKGMQHVHDGSGSKIIISMGVREDGSIVNVASPHIPPDKIRHLLLQFVQTMDIPNTPTTIIKNL